MISMLNTVRMQLLRQQCAAEALRKLHTSATCEAARKGTREKARKKKVAKVVEKVGFIPHNQRDKGTNQQRENKHVDDSWKQISNDNVWIGRYYRFRVYTVAEAIACHRETHHPSMYNVPNAPLNVEIELNMQAEKATRFVDNFQRMAMIPHAFDHGEERKILVFTKGNDEVIKAREAGATIAGGIELIKDITNGELLLSDYQYILANPNILPELVALRGLLKRKFPNPKNETLGTNLPELIEKYRNGISYKTNKDEYQQDYGLITTSIGHLDMDANKLEENLKFLLQDVNTMRPKREGKFITRVILKCPPSGELMKIDPFLYVPEQNEKFVKKTTTPAAGKKMPKIAAAEESDDEDEQQPARQQQQQQQQQLNV